MHIFILGKNRNISLAELHSRYSILKPEVLGDDFVAINLNTKFVQSDLDQLGGVIKVGRVVANVNRDMLANELVKQLSQYYHGAKLNFGISIYGWSTKNLRSLLVSSRKNLRKKEISSRFINNQFQNISAAQFKSIRQKGVELIIIKGQKHFFIAEVVAVQDIDTYSKRDYEKPFRDMKVGMLPPKLAQIMINLTGAKGTIWDPFCGGGVLLMEGLLMGHNMLGSDINTKTLDGAQMNIDWIKREFNLNSSADLFEHDATQPLIDKSFDAIACEGDLGPPQSHKITVGKAGQLVSQLDQLYVGFFEALKKAKCHQPIVIALPYFRCIDGREIDMRETLKKIEGFGFTLAPLLPEGLVKGDRFTLKYARHDQAVGRMICRFN